MGGSEQQEFVRETLGTESHATSTHALREWRHIVEGGAADILNAIRRRPPSLAAVFSALSQGWGRSTGHRLRVLSHISGGETAIDLDLMQIRAGQLLRFGADELFRHQVDDVRDGSECGLARNVVRGDKAGALELVNPVTGSDRCKKTDAICRQADDLEAKKDRLILVAGALSASTPHRKMAKAASDAARDPLLRKGKVCYGLLGDVSIALEAAADETILTTDRSFDVMGPALGLSVTRFDATEPP